MKIGNQRRKSSAAGFTAKEHLSVQKAIEKRAYELWRAGGSRAMCGLNDWLRAEREVLDEFLPTLLKR